MTYDHDHYRNLEQIESVHDRLATEHGRDNVFVTDTGNVILAIVSDNIGALAMENEDFDPSVGIDPESFATDSTVVEVTLSPLTKPPGDHSPTEIHDDIDSAYAVLEHLRDKFAEHNMATEEETVNEAHAFLQDQEVVLREELNDGLDLFARPDPPQEVESADTLVEEFSRAFERDRVDRRNRD